MQANNNANSNNIFSKFLKQESIFVNRNALLPDYVPEKPLFREKEIESIAGILKPILQKSRPANIFVYGKTGTGKTTIVKHVLNQLNSLNLENIKTAYINCNNYNSKYKVNCFLLKVLDNKDFVGYSSSYVYEQLLQYIENNEKNLVVCLDEIDKIKDLNDLIYAFTRANEELSKGSITIIGISNSIFFRHRLDARSKSSLLENEIVFRPYNAFELKEILVERAKIALKQGSYDDNALSLIAAIAAKKSGDARIALALLLKAAEIAENTGKNFIDESIVEKAEKEAEKHIVMQAIDSLPEQQKLVLMAIALLYKERKLALSLYKSKLNNNANGFIYSGEIFDKYSYLVKKLGLKPVTMRWFREYINELELFGFIALHSSGKGFKGNTRFVSLGYDADMLLSILRKYFD